MHGRNKHIAIKYHFFLDLLKDEVIELKYYSSQEQIVNFITKPLKLYVFEKLREQPKVCEF